MKIHRPTTTRIDRIIRIRRVIPIRRSGQDHRLKHSTGGHFMKIRRMPRRGREIMRRSPIGPQTPTAVSREDEIPRNTWHHTGKASETFPAAIPRIYRSIRMEPVNAFQKYRRIPAPKTAHAMGSTSINIIKSLGSRLKKPHMPRYKQKNKEKTTPA